MYFIVKIIQKELDNFFPQNAYKGTYIESIGKEFILKNIVEYNDVESILKDLSSDPEEEIDQIIVNLKKSDEKIWNLVKLQQKMNNINYLKINCNQNIDIASNLGYNGGTDIVKIKNGVITHFDQELTDFLFLYLLW